MKQLVQSVKDGTIQILDVPVPQPGPHWVLVRVVASAVSAGTERAASEFASKGVVGKAKARPDLVKQVLDKARTDGVAAARKAVKARASEPLSLGYSCAGVVLAVGSAVRDIAVGDRVACGGAGYAVHAEAVAVPQNLVVRIPDELDFDQAAFTTIGAIALHGVRLAGLEIGATVGVIGLGLVGQITAQIVKANGCAVAGYDLNAKRAELAVSLGADYADSDADLVAKAADRLSGGVGCDAILVAADTPSSDPVAMAARLARDRAVVVVVGNVGMDVSRRDYYGKELTLRVARSYGPGRYDRDYEEHGMAYPTGYVRWTETRNMEAFATLVAQRRVDVASLITNRYAFAQAPAAYKALAKPGPLGILLTYPAAAPLDASVSVQPAKQPPRETLRIGLVGAGSFATSTLIPAMRDDRATFLATVCTASGLRAQDRARRFGFARAATDAAATVADPGVDAIVIATPHDTHAALVTQGLDAGKHVFCEKPLCLTEDELAGVVRAATDAGRVLSVGYNRRFAPLVGTMIEHCRASTEPMVAHYRVNAGALPANHWLADAGQGGRIVGEVCHFVDLMSAVFDALPAEVDAVPVGDAGGVTATLRFASGSVATIHYLTNAPSRLPKERLEVFVAGRAATLDNFRKLELIGSNGKRTRRRSRQDKGHVQSWKAFAAAARGDREAPFTLESLVATSLATFAIEQSMRERRPVAIDAAAFVARATR